MIDDVVDQTLALVLWARDANGDDDVAVFTGFVRRAGAKYVLELANNPPLELLDRWLPRIRPATREIQDIVEGAHFVLSLSVQDAKAASGQLRSTGLRWPRDPA